MKGLEIFCVDFYKKLSKWVEGFRRYSHQGVAELKVSAWSASGGKHEVFLLGLVFTRIVQYYQAEIIQTCKSRYILVVRRNVMEL